jgi:hypothetical protein
MTDAFNKAHDMRTLDLTTLQDLADKMCGNLEAAMNQTKKCNLAMNDAE